MATRRRSDARVTTPAVTDPRDIYTPARLNREARLLLERGFPSLWVEGELSNLSRPASGHWYFSLKDEAAQLRCAMFRQKNLLVPFSPRDGMHVVVRGRISLYEPRGDYQLLVEHLEEAGEGALRRQFELLKARLAGEGLFAADRKRLPPELPRRIGIVTSPSGAAIRDILHVLARRFPAVPVRIYPTSVQGQAAAAEIAAAIRRANERRDCDVLIVARGGGSLEDLWPFNEEVVARAIFDCDVPVISGVGHEIDVTITDFVADVRAPTPSAAAELVVPDAAEWLRGLVANERRLLAAWRRSLRNLGESLGWARRRLAQLHPGVGLRQKAQQLDDLEQRLAAALRRAVITRRSELAQCAERLARCGPGTRLALLRGREERLALRLATAMNARLERWRNRVGATARTLDAVSPLATLARGYAIVTDADDHVITRAAQLQVGASISARLAAGRFAARVESVDHEDGDPPERESNQ